MMSEVVTQWWKRQGVIEHWRRLVRRNRARNTRINRNEVTSTQASTNVETKVISTDTNTIPISIGSRIPRIKYGELVKLGYNGGNFRQNKSRYVVFQRFEANGVKISKQYKAQSFTPSTSQTAEQATHQKHSISYVLSEKKAVVVEYRDDPETDMFQIGRSSKNDIDFHVSILLHGRKPNSKVTYLSRYGCRILFGRTDASAKLFAAGFDSHREIFLGQKATKWEDNGEMDGLTTNGVLIMHPKGHFGSGTLECGVWRECSVGGKVMNLRKSRYAEERTEKIPDETNVLQDGTLIDLCGVTLIWRSVEGLKNTPTKSDIEKRMVGLNTLLAPREVTSSEPTIRPYFFLQCEHIQLYKELEQDKSTDERICTMCLLKGPVIALSMGLEPAFYVDSDPPTFAFIPCGHMASEMTVKYWASINIPKDGREENNEFKAVCPFCRTFLSEDTGFVKLKF